MIHDPDTVFRLVTARPTLEAVDAALDAAQTRAWVLGIPVTVFDAFGGALGTFDPPNSLAVELGLDQAAPSRIAWAMLLEGVVS